MNRHLHQLILGLLGLSLFAITVPNCLAGSGDESVTEGVNLSAAQREMAGIRIETLEARRLDYQLYAPGEVMANGYTSFLVSPRVDSVVLRRYVGLGAQVVAGEPLVTLFSETVAEAQAALRVADAEWQRVKHLGRKAVGDKRYIESQADFEVSWGRLSAFGLSDTAITSITEKQRPFGEYTLVALGSGIVFSDDFRQGQRVESGYPLMEIADEEELWVEARLSPHTGVKVPAGSEAEVLVGGGRIPATVIQEAFTIDEQTRTRVVRLLVKNELGRLHPGMYADVYFKFVTEKPVLAVPESALMRGADGDWLVYLQDSPDHFVASEVELGRSLNGWREITGVSAGSLVVMEGAFFVDSERNKSGFASDDH